MASLVVSDKASNKAIATSLVTAFLLSVCAAPSAWAQDDPALLESVKQCAQIQDPAARYACYDRSTATLRPMPAEAVGRPSQPTSPNLPVLRTTPAPANGPFADLTSEPQPVEPVELIDTIATVKEHEPGQLMVTLANGQVWYQQDTRRYPLRSGMEVRIYPGLFGASWRMSSTELKSFMQVKRLK